MFVAYGPFMGVISTATDVHDARDQARAWLISQGMTDEDVTAMFADYPWDPDAPAWWLDVPSTEPIWGFVYEGYPDAFEVWAIGLAQGYYFTHPDVIRDL